MGAKRRSSVDWRYLKAVRLALPMALAEASTLPEFEFGVVCLRLEEAVADIELGELEQARDSLEQSGAELDLLDSAYDVDEEFEIEIPNGEAILRRFANRVGIPERRQPGALARREGVIEDADDALLRQSKPELFNEVLASGAVAASLTAAATVAKAKIEATTQRHKDELEAQTQRLKIASDERIAGFQARAQIDPADGARASEASDGE
ncbi:hypothetical protein [Streptomyces sp. NPDC056634]|uniref:hypothetical protein n=1 Tax=Streptomyces sp. NPDC056634 TaxID=3345885 RepID=UPI0036C60BDF